MRMETKRLYVRPLTAADEEALFAVLSDEEVMRWIEPPYSLEQTRAFLLMACGAELPPVYGVEEKASGLLVGHLIFHPFDGTAWELGWILRRDRWGRGFASELTAAAVATAREIRIPALVLECCPEQLATRRLAERFGFQPEAGDGPLLRFRLRIEGDALPQSGERHGKTWQFSKKVSLSGEDSVIIP